MSEYSGRGLSRRDFLLASAAVTGIGISGVRPAQAQTNWRKFAGTSLEVNLITSPRGELLLKYQKEFEDLTGIKVNADQMPEQQQRQKSVIELTSGKPSFDVIHLSFHVQKRQFEKAGWLADLNPYMQDPTLTEPSLVRSDFAEAGLAYGTDSGGAMRGLPFNVDYWIIYWNKALFAKKNLAYPTTFDEMVAAALALTDPATQTYGFVARGQRNANVPVWTSFMLGYGSPTLDAAGKLLTDTPAAIEAAKIYQTLLTKAAPPGVIGFNWAECQSAFLQGKIGMWLDGIGFAPPLEDPEKSRVVGQVGYGEMPKGPKAHACATFGDGIGVTSTSTKKEAAYLYCQWAVSKSMGARLMQSGGGVPFRNSVINDPEVRKGVKMPADWVDAIAKSARISQLGLPVIIPVTEFRDVIGVALTNTLSGADPAVELRRATEEFRPILERSEHT
jgi:multiple sugar transport system substrate-binding protein